MASLTARAAFIAAASVSLPATAQVWATQALVHASVTATNNGNEAPDNLAQRDLIVAIEPTLRLTRRSAALDLNGEFGLVLEDYVNNTQQGRLWPKISADAHWTAVERAFYLDAAVDSRAEQSDPYAGRLQTDSTDSMRTATAARISPYTLVEFAPNWSLVARADASWDHPAAEDSTTQHAYQGVLRVERLPVPWGLSAEYRAQDFDYGDTAESDLRLQTLRAGTSYAFGGQFVAGFSLGAEQSRYGGVDDNEAIYGVGLRWNPGPRTLIAGEVAHRIYGTAWQLEARHRWPMMMVSLSSSREPAGSSYGGYASRHELSDVLDAIFSSRYPDPIERQKVVADLIASRGLNEDLPDASRVLSEYAQLESATRASWVWYGTRNTLTVAAFQEQAHELNIAGSTALLERMSDYRQRGVSVQFNRRLTPQTTLDALWEWSQIEGLADRLGDRTNERSYRLSLAQNLSPRSAVSIGLRYLQVDTTVSGLNSYDAASGFVGLDHRF